MKRIIAAVLVGLMLVAGSASARDFSLQERRTVGAAEGFWSNSSGDEVWRFALNKDGTFAVAFDDWSVSDAKILEIYPEHKTFNLLIGDKIASVNVSVGYMTLSDDSGRAFMARFVRPLNQRDWDFMESIWRPNGHTCTFIPERCE